MTLIRLAREWNAESSCLSIRKETRWIPLSTKSGRKSMLLVQGLIFSTRLEWVGVVSRYMENPTTTHLKAAKRIPAVTFTSGGGDDVDMESSDEGKPSQTW